MKQQISNRLGVAHVRDTMMQFVTGAITRQQAMESLQVGQSQLYSLRTSYLAARAQGRGDDWEPGSSGGNHMPAWPDKVQSFLRRALEPDGDAKRYSYAFAASEVRRRFGFPVDRSQVRHWAIAHNLHLADHRARPPAHVRRWQRKSVGAPFISPGCGGLSWRDTRSVPLGGLSGLSWPSVQGTSPSFRQGRRRNRARRYVRRRGSSTGC